MYCARIDLRGPGRGTGLGELAVDEIQEVLRGDLAGYLVVGAVTDDAGVNTVVEVRLLRLGKRVGLVAGREVCEDRRLYRLTQLARMDNERKRIELTPIATAAATQVLLAQMFAWLAGPMQGSNLSKCQIAHTQDI